MTRDMRCSARGGTRLIVALAIVLAAPVSMPSSAAEATPEALYTMALARERGLREPGVPASLNELRAAIAGYEEILRRFPRSVFEDHALWQGAGLAIEAYEQFRQRQDLDTGVRLLRRLSATHPDSAFAGRVPDRLGRFDALADVAQLTAVSRELLPDAVRVTMTLDREVTYRSEQLASPPRWFFDLHGTQASPELRHATLVFTDDGDVVRRLRFGRHANQVTRVVLDAENTESCHAFTRHDPFQIVVDCSRALPVQSPTLAGARASLVFDEPRLDQHLPEIGVAVVPVPPPAAVVSFAPAPSIPVSDDDRPFAVTRLDSVRATAARPSSDPDGVYSVARQLGLGISRVVIDAGHGGHDPGAMGADVTEADLVLDLALRLEKRLQATQPALEVVLTRRGDRYLPLEARTTLANRVGADLFLSIHANASRNTSARGVETYFLDLAVDPTAEAQAARENVGGVATMQHLDGLLRAIASNSKLDESRKFAQTVQQLMLSTLRTIDPTIPDLGVKQAPFVVLIGARMPSILTEVSFLTNQHDAARLATDAYRDLIVDALLSAILQYQRSLGSQPMLARAGND